MATSCRACVAAVLEPSVAASWRGMASASVDPDTWGGGFVAGEIRVFGSGVTPGLPSPADVRPVHRSAEDDTGQTAGGPSALGEPNGTRRRGALPCCFAPKCPCPGGDSHVVRSGRDTISRAVLVPAAARPGSGGMWRGPPTSSCSASLTAQCCFGVAGSSRSRPILGPDHRSPGPRRRSHWRLDPPAGDRCAREGLSRSRQGIPDDGRDSDVLVRSVRVVALGRDPGHRSPPSVLGWLGEHPHSTAEAIRRGVGERAGPVSHRAVYDVLKACGDAGLVRRIKPAGGPALFERRVGDNHHHLVCRGCGDTADVHCAVGAAPCLAPNDDHGIVVDEAEIAFWGLCSSCTARSPRIDANAAAGDPPSLGIDVRHEENQQ